jgi:hypothetical protein
MSFLAPLFALGAAAIALPILFHLIRRTPRSRQPFSSLMFLTPSPPRLTRRSRLDQLLLLLLRGLILLVLAVAFARPFLREATQLTFADLPGQRLVVLVDRSASMQRAKAWLEAQQQVRLLVSRLQPADELALLLFDEQTELVVDFDTFRTLPASSRVQQCVQAVAEREPTYRGTDLAGALVMAADLIQQVPDGSTATRHQIVLISDLQQGASLEQLQAYAWPAEVAVAVRRVAQQTTGNVTIRVLGNEQDSDPRPRVRITNTQDATREQFTLRWQTGHQLGNASLKDASTIPVAMQVGATASSSASADGAAGDDLPKDTLPPNPETRATSAHEGLAKAAEQSASQRTSDTTRTGTQADATLSVQVPAGQHRVIRFARPEHQPDADMLVVTGDEEPFDNTFYSVAPRQESIRVLYLGDDRADDPEGMHYFLNAALAQLPRTRVDLQPLTAAALALEAAPQRPRLAVVTSFSEAVPWAALLDYVAQGGTLLFVAGEPTESTRLSRFEPLSSVVVETEPGPAAGSETETNKNAADGTTDRTTRRFALWEEIDFTHPVFAELNSPTYGDFTQIHFWKRTRFRLTNVPEARILARFDDGSPAFWEQAHQSGSIFVLASGWRPEDSQLALSSKFVPLLTGLLEHAGGGRRDQAGLTVGQSLTLPTDQTRSASQLKLPNGRLIELAADVRQFQATDQPGIYEWANLETSARWAVNLTAAESDTAPLDPQQLEAFGVKLGDQPTAKEEWERQRQLRDTELESRQQLWRWLLVATLVLIACETWLASRQSQIRK